MAPATLIAQNATFVDLDGPLFWRDRRHGLFMMKVGFTLLKRSLGLIKEHCMTRTVYLNGEYFQKMKQKYQFLIEAF